MKTIKNTATIAPIQLPHSCGVRLTTSLRDHATNQPNGLSAYIHSLIFADMVQRGEVVNNGSK